MFTQKHQQQSEALLQYGASDFSLALLKEIPFLDLAQLSVNLDHPKVAFRAAWALEHIVLKNTYLIEEHQDLLIQNYCFSENWSVLRSYSKIMMWMTSKANQSFDLTELEEENIIEKTFQIIEDTSCPVAVLVNAFDILFQCIPNHPWLAQELKLQIELQLEKEPSAALKSRGNKLLKALSKIKY